MSNKEIFLIDSENVSKDFMVRVFDRNKYDSTVVIFYTDTSIGKIKNLNPMKYTVVGGNMNIEFRHCHAGNNSLDFNLVAYLGCIVESMRRGNVYIVSNDRGYDTILHEFANGSVHVRRLSEIHGLLGVENSSLVNLEDGQTEVKKPIVDEAELQYRQECLSKIKEDLIDLEINEVIAKGVAKLIFDNILQSSIKLNCEEIRHIYVTKLEKGYSQAIFSEEVKRIKSLYSKYIYSGELLKTGVSTYDHDKYVHSLENSLKSGMSKGLSKFGIKKGVCDSIAETILDCAKVGTIPSKLEIKDIMTKYDSTYTAGKTKKLVNRIYSSIRGMYHDAFHSNLLTWQREGIEVNYSDKNKDAVEEVKSEPEAVENKEEHIDIGAMLVDRFVKGMKFTTKDNYTIIIDRLNEFVNDNDIKLWKTLFGYNFVVRNNRDDVIFCIIEYLWGVHENNLSSNFSKTITSLQKYCRRYNSKINGKKLCERIRKVVCDDPLAVEIVYKLLKYKYIDNTELHIDKSELQLDDWREELIFLEV